MTYILDPTDTEGKKVIWATEPACWVIPPFDRH
jgi:hypothetical protein